MNRFSDWRIFAVCLIAASIGFLTDSLVADGTGGLMLIVAILTFAALMSGLLFVDGYADSRR